MRLGNEQSSGDYGAAADGTARDLDECRHCCAGIGLADRRHVRPRSFSVMV